MADDSISKKLKSEAKIDDLFEIRLNNLTLEEIIQLKLELAGRSLNGEPYGFKIFKTIPDIVKEACYKFADASFPTKKTAATFLGITERQLRKLAKKYKTDIYSNRGEQ